MPGNLELGTGTSDRRMSGPEPFLCSSVKEQERLRALQAQWTRQFCGGRVEVAVRTDVD